MTHVTDQVISRKLKTPKKCCEKIEVLTCSIDLSGGKLIVLVFTDHPKLLEKTTS